MKMETFLKHPNGNFVLVDVREPDEFSDGHIPGAVNIPTSNFRLKLPALYPDKNTHFVTYCVSGQRCRAVNQALEMMGYTNVEVLEGGYQEWVQEHSEN